MSLIATHLEIQIPNLAFLLPFWHISVKFRAKKEDEARKSGDEGLDMDIPDEVSTPVFLKSLKNDLHR